MAGDQARCAVESHYGLHMAPEVAGSADWMVRVTGGFGFRHPRVWRWDIALRERARGRIGCLSLSIFDRDADIAYEMSFVVLTCARSLVERSASDIWSLGLAFFDARVLDGFRFVYKRLGGYSGTHRRCARRDERRWRHDWQVLVSSVQKEKDVFTDLAVAAGWYAQVTQSWCN